MIDDFKKICRTCLGESTDSKSLFNVQFVNNERLRLSEILTACTSIEILESDDLPKQVCSHCEHNILSTFSFQQQCHKSDSVLRTVISESVRSQLIELKPLDSIEDSSLNSSIPFSEILGEDAALHNEVDTFGSKTENRNNSLNEVINSQLTTDIILNKDKPTGSLDLECDEDHSICTSAEYSYDLVDQQKEAEFNYQVGQDELKNIKNEVDEEDETMQPLFACEANSCFACFTTREDLKFHSKTHFPKYNYCKVCNKTFSSASTLSRHVTSKHQPNKKVHLCSNCGKGFARSDDLKRHIRVHTGERPFSCKKCGKAFAQSFRLLEHMRSHSNIKNFVCAICGKAFARYTSLLAHNKTHNKIKSHQCKKCGKRLCGSGSLSMHMKIHTGQKDFVCNFCKKSFTSVSNLIVHKRTHTGERPYACLTCGKSFPDNSRLNVHCRIHSGEKPYVCTYCGKGSVSSTQLKRHIRIHTGEKPYGCNLCPKKFTRSEDLKNHIKIHKDERNYICSICQKGFFQRGTLKVHMRIHTGEKPYTCDICHRSFSQTGPYSTHMKKHSQEEKYIVQPPGYEKGSVLHYI